LVGDFPFFVKYAKKIKKGGSDRIVCLAYHIMFTSFFFAKKYIKRGAKKQMEKEKYP